MPGSAWSNGFLGLLDGLEVTLNSAEVGSVNFELLVPVELSRFSVE